MLEEIVRATVISLFEREKLKAWPSVEDMSMIISDVQEIHSANLEEEEYFEILEAREQPF